MLGPNGAGKTTCISVLLGLRKPSTGQARLFGLECAGEGTLGTLACGFIAPHLQRFNGREFPLMALPLGKRKLP